MYPAELKYVMVRETCLDVPIVFPNLIKHSEIARKEDIVSAGFCVIDGPENSQCYGRSDSLGIESRPEDTKILRRYLYTPY